MVQGTHLSSTWAGYCLGAWLLLCASLAQAQNGAAVLLRAAELRETPAASATSLGPLPVQTPVTRLGERQGAWVRVKTMAGAVGWVHLFDLGSADTPAATASGGNSNPATSALRGLSGFFNKSSARTPVASAPTSTLGIRGLGAEDIAQAQPNLPAVSSMEAQRLNEAQARQFAARATWASVAVEPLPAPPRPAAAPAQSGEVSQ